MVVVLKLGGSVITQKDQPETVDADALAACARAIGEFDGDLLLVHGGGSFGHFHAERHGVTVTAGTADPGAVVSIHDSMRALNHHVITALHEHAVAAIGVEPLSLAHRDEAGTLSVPVRGLSTVIDGAFVPVLFGDVIPHAGEGFTVMSGDELTVALADGLDATRVGLCSGVPGVLDDQGDVLARIESFSDVADTVGGSPGWDVTGGMAGKVRELLQLPMPASIFGLDALPGFLAGEAVGTRIDGSTGDAAGTSDETV